MRYLIENNSHYKPIWRETEKSYLICEKGEEPRNVRKSTMKWRENSYVLATPEQCKMFDQISIVADNITTMVDSLKQMEKQVLDKFTQKALAGNLLLEIKNMEMALQATQEKHL